MASSMDYLQMSQRKTAGQKRKCMTHQVTLPSTGELVDQSGFGAWQLRVFVLAPFMCYYIDGAEFALVNIISKAVSNEFGIGKHASSWLITTSFLGLLIGGIASGFFGDIIGRRPVILWSFATCAVAGFVGSAATGYVSLLFCHFALGAGMGFSFAPSLVLLSENTPEHWRISIRAGSRIATDAGAFWVALLAAGDDPALGSLHWRSLMKVCALMPFVWFILASFMLPESPVFMACTGRHDEASEVFADMRFLNGIEDKHDAAQVWYAQPELEGGTVTPSPADQLRMIFAPRLWLATVAGVVACFCLNLAYYGHLYAMGQVFHSDASVQGAWQFERRQCFMVAMVVPCIFLNHLMSRKCAMFTSMLLFAVACIGVAISGVGPPPRPQSSQTLFQIASLGIGMAYNMGYISIYQFALEVYPTTAASAGSAFTICTGRLGALFASWLFDSFHTVTGEWVVFYYWIAILCGSAAALLWISPTVLPYSSGCGQRINENVHSRFAGGYGGNP